MLENIYAIAAVLVVTVLSVSEVLKQTLNINTRYMPIVSVMMGVAVGYGASFLTSHDTYVMLCAGFIAGLTASGTFDLLKASKKVSDTK